MSVQCSSISNWQHISIMSLQLGEVNNSSVPHVCPSVCIYTTIFPSYIYFINKWCPESSSQVKALNLWLGFWTSTAKSWIHVHLLSPGELLWSSCDLQTCWLSSLSSSHRSKKKIHLIKLLTWVMVSTIFCSFKSFSLNLLTVQSSFCCSCTPNVTTRTT